MTTNPCVNIQTQIAQTQIKLSKGEKLIHTRWEEALRQPRKPGSLPTHGAVEKTLVGAGHVINSFKNPLLYGVGKVSNYMLLHTSDTFQMQGARFNCYERQYKLFDLGLPIFVLFRVFYFIYFR